MLRSACSGPRGGEVRPLRRRKSGSETPKLQSMSYGDAQTLRSVFPAPLRDARLPLQRSQLLRLLARHGLKFWSLRPRLPTAKWSQFLSPWPGTCRTQHQISFDHRSPPQLSLFVARARHGGRGCLAAGLATAARHHHTRTEPAAPTTVDFHASARSARSARSDDRPDRTIGRSPSDARPIAVGRGQWDLANAVNLANPVNDPPQRPICDRFVALHLSTKMGPSRPG